MPLQGHLNIVQGIYYVYKCRKPTPNAEPERKAQGPPETYRKLAGTGGADGTVTYRWMEGGFFLIQDVDLIQNGAHIIGVEIIGHLRPFGEPESPALTSRFYDNQGNTLDYEYEISGDDLTIWAGAKDSPAYFKGTFSQGDKINKGAWVYPGGYGYESTMTKMEE